MTQLLPDEAILELFGPDSKEMLKQAFLWLDINEPMWDSKKPIDRLKYAQDLVAHRGQCNGD